MFALSPFIFSTVDGSFPAHYGTPDEVMLLAVGLILSALVLRSVGRSKRAKRHREQHR